MRNVFEFTDYKSFLREIINDENAPRGFQSTLAKAANCQSSYLSQVVSGKPQISEDIGLRIGRFLNMTPLQLEYFLNLIRLGRSNDEEFRSFIMMKILQDQRQQLNIAQNIDSSFPITNTDFAGHYTSDLLVSIIHMISFSEKYKTLPQICQRLGISEARALEVIQVLEALKTIEFSNGVLKPSVTSTHVPANSEHNRTYQIQRRLLAINSIQKCDFKKNLHYSGIFTLSEEDFESLKIKIVDFISQAHKKIETSPAIELYGMCLDAFIVPS